MINIAIIDDDTEVCESLKKMIVTIYGDAVKVNTFVSVRDFVYMQEDTKTQPSDVVLMDIVLDEGLGIDLAIEYEKLNKKAKTIFITGYIDYAPDIFRAKPFGLLRKPINANELKAAIDKAVMSIEEEKQCYIKLESKEAIRNVRLNDIIYIESEARKLYVHTSEEKVDVYMKLDDMEEKIKSNSFIRCHKSYLVNAKYVNRMENGKMVVNGNISIPVSRNRSEASKLRLMEYIQGTIK